MANVVGWRIVREKRAKSAFSGEGARIFDFLRNPEPYKYAWGARDQINRRISLTTSDHAALAGSIRAW